MKTEFEISSGIASYVNSQEGVTDFAVPLKQIADEVDTLRVRLITELDTKGLLIRPYHNYTQNILYGGTDEQKVHLINNVRIIDLPKLLILSNGKPAITYIGAYNGTQNYRVVTGLQREWYKKDRWISKVPTALVYENDENDGYKIEFRNVSPNKVKLTAIFEDPSDLEGYNGYDWDVSLYPCNSGMVDAIIGKTAESYIRTMYKKPIQANQTVDSPMTPKLTQ